MSSAFRQYLGEECFPEDLTEAEIAGFFTLTDDERRAVDRRRRPLNRLGVALQIGFLKLTGTALNSVEIIPQGVLRLLGEQLDTAAPQLASIRALYHRRRTLFEHQAAAKDALGVRDLTDHGERALNSFLRREAAQHFEVAELADVARGWLVEHRYTQLPARRIRAAAADARRRQDDNLIERVVLRVGQERLASWREALAEVMANEKTRMEWLRDAPASRRPKGLADQVAKIDFLKSLGAEQLDLGLSTGMLKALARTMLYRKPATLRRMRGGRRILEIACFLRLQLLRLTDDGLVMLDYGVADLWRRARTRAEASVEEELKRHQDVLLKIRCLIDDAETPDGAIRGLMGELLAPFVPDGSVGRSTKVGRVRGELARAGRSAADLLKAAGSVRFDLAPEHPLAQAFATLAAVATSGHARLPEGAANPFGKTWARLIDQSDRHAALGGYRAATLMLLKRSLRNGQASVGHSLGHRAPDDRLIPKAQWQKERSRFMRNLSAPSRPETAIRLLKRELAEALEKLDAAVSRGDVRIKNGRLVVPKLKAAPQDAGLASVRRALFAGVGKVQLPDLLVEIDAAVGFSSVLLGRRPRGERELVVLYAATIALGSDLTAADMERMTVDVDAESVGDMMRRIEAGGRAPLANRAVLNHFLSLPVATLWGPGLNASADMMSLDATRRLWSARHDPRRRTPAVGTYTHVLDQWPIISDQPVVLNRRQAGAAIEGALRNEDIDLHRVAVDTHGHTHFAMGVTHFLGSVLSPRLAGMNKRRLYLPRGMTVPESLKSVVSETVSTRAVVAGWDALARIAASTKAGWCSAGYVLDRFGSAARGDAAFAAGDALGRMLLTRFWGTYLGDPDYRRANDALLSQGESVHTLQRAIYAGAIGAKHGRTPEQMAAISSCLTLLTNVVMAWNAGKIGEARLRSPETFPDRHVMHIAPNAHEHVNTKGVITIDVSPHRDRLLGGPPPGPKIMAAV